MAQATFFCVGENVEKHPNIFQQIQSANHTVGHHTYHHLNGWATDNDTYIHDAQRGAEVTGSNLFRPPYGRIKPQQAQRLRQEYQMIMWDVLSGDFDQKISPERCLKNIITSATAGSIVVLHDSLKAEKNLKFALPRTLAYFAERGYQFAALRDVGLPTGRTDLTDICRS